MSTAKTCPVKLKRARVYVQRAEEMDANPNPASKIIAFYCRNYAMSVALELHKKIPAADQGTVTPWLMGLMDELEREKGTITIPDREAGKEIMRQYALTVFKRCDDQDRSGAANMSTAKQFANAAYYMDVCKQFGELDADMAEMVKYAKVKSLQISRAIKEGKAPPSGPPGGETLSFSMPAAPAAAPEAALPSVPTDLPAAPTAPTDLPGLPPSAPTDDPFAGLGASTSAGATSAGAPAYGYSAPPSVPAAKPAPAPAARPVETKHTPAPRPSSSSSRRRGGALPANVTDAIELLNFARAALEANDTELAKQRMRTALGLL